MNFSDLKRSEKKASVFEDRYIALRKKEGRLYTDEEVSRLPDIDKHHPYFHEWSVRSRSCKKLIHYLEKKRRNLHILEIGSGNGWLSNRLSGITGAKVLGIEINTPELQQAKRVFANRQNMYFIQADFNKITSGWGPFDIVVIAASLQYFSSVKEVLENIRHHFLKPDGEIHILDSPFYKEDEIKAARKRTEEYYTQIGFREMISWYHHHNFSELNSFSYCFMDSGVLHRVLFSRKPRSFYWIRIKNNQNAITQVISYL